MTATAKPKRKPRRREKAAEAPKPPNARSQALDAAISQIEKAHGKGAVMSLGGLYETADGLSTGSISIDRVIGGVLGDGRVVEIYGPEASGKTTITLGVIAQAQREGGEVAFIDAEHALDIPYAKRLGVNVGDLWLSQPDNGEQALGIAEILAASGAFRVIVIDSVAALVPKAELEGEMGAGQPGMQARLMSQALRKLTATVKKSKCLMIFTNQMRMKIGVRYGNPETTSGGNALKFYASYRLEVRNVGQVKVGDEIVGHRARIRGVKVKTAPPFKQCEVSMVYGRGIWRPLEIVEVAEEDGVIAKQGTWYSYGETRLGQGRMNAAEFLETYPHIMAAIEKELRDVG